MSFGCGRSALGCPRGSRASALAGVVRAHAAGRARAATRRRGGRRTAHAGRATRTRRTAGRACARARRAGARTHSCAGTGSRRSGLAGRRIRCAHLPGRRARAHPTCFVRIRRRTRGCVSARHCSGHTTRDQRHHELFHQYLPKKVVSATLPRRRGHVGFSNGYAHCMLRIIRGGLPHGLRLSVRSTMRSTTVFRVSSSNCRKWASALSCASCRSSRVRAPLEYVAFVVAR